MQETVVAAKMISNTSTSESNSAQDVDINSIWDSVAIIHIIVVIVPTLLLGITVLMLLYKNMKSSGTSQISVLYTALVSACLVAVLSYGIPWDISLLTQDAVLINCTTKAAALHLMVYFGFHSLLAITTAEIAIVQFVILKYGKNVIKTKVVILCFLLAVLISFGFNGIWWNGTWSEIVGSHCNLDRITGTINTVIWMASIYISMVTVIVIFSIFTCVTVKRGVLRENSYIVTSVVTVNIINISVHLIFRIFGLVVYFLAVAFARQDQLGMWTIIARYINEITYPAFLISITFVNRSLRKELFSLRLL